MKPLILFIAGGIAGILSAFTTNAQDVVGHQLQHMNIDEMPVAEIRAGITLRSASGIKGTFGYFTMKKGVTVPMHSHENEQYSFILEGSVRATIGDTVLIIRKGEMVLIPANVPHSFTSLEKTIDLDFFSPRREDWINGTADYFKK